MRAKYSFRKGKTQGQVLAPSHVELDGDVLVSPVGDIPFCLNILNIL